ncbi:ABC transporter substrate-binding protein [Streptomyces mobaraensis NBRC 13819 = DSM 40847]|uniref:ABC transporter n=1 Tax=Streptomyces mobaraensis (strain ATCC 29032 / DSM 40847 / JCM 4168 / NBRC 13819 / NCIMB 11159 / IPCR 16-22) TaxID=1223523 RepID=M3BYM9_STRM1|nr:ABC transporter substrate-binding protein [Streptomyces mobaraensis]EME96771.1 ABC transporter [Streptomyces mobaraensis NBRC 13819 = DSM 40847]QTT75524.1 ABC transporter substrate-binding protein [Streptomyces mobaraensis NBRC 13819 = DSM 40847]
MRRHDRRAPYAVALAAGALVVSACSSGGGGGGGGGDGKSEGPGEDKTVSANYSIGSAADAAGPAPELPGAKKGGTVTVLQRDAFNHLDPGQIYFSDVLTSQMLYNRSLTSYKIDEKGRVKVVGDLATDSGTSSDGGKTWKFTLKDGLKFEDGSPITSKDVRWGIERLYAPFETDGPLYIPQWLNGDGNAFRKALPDGPYQGKHLPSSVLDTPDDKTIVFHFQAPHADTPYATAMPNIGAVKAEKDGQRKYDNAPFSSGPYKVGSYKVGKSLTLVRNEHWDPKTDPIRHQYADRFEIGFGHQFADSTRRFLADQGGDKNALSFSNGVAPEMTEKVLGQQDTKARRLLEVQPYVDYISFNTTRLKDVKVRKALAYAMPNGQILQQNGGASAGVVATNYLSPAMDGYRPTDPYGKKDKPAGDPEKARALLKEAGKEGQEIVYAYANTDVQQKVSVVVTQALERAGFKVQKKEIDSNTWRTSISEVGNKFDIYRTSWGADWPVSSTVVPPLYDGRQIADGAQNYGHLDDPKVNAEIDRITRITDVKQAGAEWQKLADRILTDDVPGVPTFYNRLFSLWGSGLGGVKYHPVYGTVDPTGVFVK